MDGVLFGSGFVRVPVLEHLHVVDHLIDAGLGVEALDAHACELRPHRVGKAHQPAKVLGHQGRQILARAGLAVHQRKPVAAIGDVHQVFTPARDVHLQVSMQQERRHVLERDRCGLAILDVNVEGDLTRRRVQDDPGDGFLGGHHPHPHQHRGHANGAMAAHVQVAGAVGEHHPGGGALGDRWQQVGHDQRIVPSGLADQCRADMVQVLPQPLPLLEHGVAGHVGKALGDHPGGLTLSVGVDRLDALREARHGRYVTSSMIGTSARAPMRSGNTVTPTPRPT